MNVNRHDPMMCKTISSDCREEVNLLDYWYVIRKRKKFITLVVGSVTLVSVIVSLLLPKVYKSSAVIMPLGGSNMSGLAAIAAQFSGLPLIGELGGDSVQTPAQQFMALLNTRTLAEDIIGKFDLLKVIYKDSWDEKNSTWKDANDVPDMEEAVKKLKSGYMGFFDEKKKGTIKIVAMFTDAILSAKVANGYVDGLQQFINRNSFTVAKRNRIFIERQLIENKKDLLEVGKEVNEFYKDGRVSNVASRVNVLLGVNNEFNFGTDNLIAGYSENTEDVWNMLEYQKSELKKKFEETRVVEDVPQQVYLQYLTLRRELLGSVNSLLTQQYEMAKIDEAKEDLAFQVIDPARAPIKRFKPQRRKIVMVSFFASLFLAIFMTFFLEYVRRMKKLQSSGR